jgi:uncharacterized protein (DUF934 family)
MRRIIKGGEVVADGWRHVATGDDGLPEGDIIVPLETWRATRDALLARGTRLGIRIEAGDDPSAITDDLEHFAVIALDFPKFSDGRAFTTARLLRERHGYTGELRAVGDVLRDQLFFMKRCGIDAFELRADKDLDDALAAFSEISVAYQPTTDESQPIYRRR